MGWILPNKGFQHNWVEIYFDLALLLLFTVFNSQVLKMKKTKKQPRTHSYIFRIRMLESVRMGKSLAFEKQSAFTLKWKKKNEKKWGKQLYALAKWMQNQIEMSADYITLWVLLLHWIYCAHIIQSYISIYFILFHSFLSVCIVLCFHVLYL